MALRFVISRSQVLAALAERSRHDALPPQTPPEIDRPFAVPCELIFDSGRGSNIVIVNKNTIHINVNANLKWRDFIDNIKSSTGCTDTCEFPLAKHDANCKQEFPEASRFRDLVGDDSISSFPGPDSTQEFPPIADEYQCSYCGQTAKAFDAVIENCPATFGSFHDWQGIVWSSEPTAYVPRHRSAGSVG